MRCMAAAIDSAQLTALAALLETARDLVGELAKDANVARLLRAFLRLAPDEREVIAGAFERAIAWRKVNESLAPIAGVHLRANPNPRLFVRVVDPDDSTRPLTPDADEVLVGTLRILRHARVMLVPEARQVWEPALTSAFDLLEPREQAACVAFAEDVARILRDLATAAETAGEPGTGDD